MTAPVARRPTTAAVPVPSVDSSLALKLLPAVLSVVAGSADVISYLGLGGLFVAHITGNLVIVAAHVVARTHVSLALMLSVPVFILVLALSRLAAAGLEAVGLGSLRPLLLLQALLLVGFLVISVAAVSSGNPNTASAIVAALLGVSAMAVQNALVQISVRGAPSTAVMTTNITRFVMDVGEVLFGRDPTSAAQARYRAVHTWPAVVGFAVGAGVGAALFAAMGLTSLVLPTGLALAAIVWVAAS